MAADEQYERKIREDYTSHADLLNLWAGIKAGSTPGWQTGKAFEYLIIRAFELEGATVYYPFSIFMRNPETGQNEQIEQLDGAVFSDEFACLIESKAETAPQNFEPIAKLRSQLLRRPGSTIGSVFSLNGFTEPAVTLTMQTAPQAVLLWDGNDIEFALDEYGKSARGMRWGMMVKYRNLVLRVIPNYALIKEGYGSV